MTYSIMNNLIFFTDVTPSLSWAKDSLSEPNKHQF